MITPLKLKKYDKSGMCQVYDKWPELAKEFFNMNQDSIDFKGIDHMVFVGMGGSGALGDTLFSSLSKTNMHLCVVKGYHLPKTVDSHTLVVASSVSGNTPETLTVLDKANKTNCKIVAFSSGGRMEKYCKKNRIEYRKIPMLNSPRASFPVYLYTMLNILNPVIPLKNHDVIESIRYLEKTRKQISSSNLNDSNPSIDLASWLSGVPAIYYPMGLQAAAIRFKNSLQENAKMHVFAEDIIEACHNGIVSWERPSIVRPILIQGKDDYVKTKKLWKIIKEYFNLNKIDFKEVYSIRGNILSKIVNLVYLLDYATIYRAILSNMDPTPIRSIDFIKERMM
ncbi:putative bifunctional phosphoglucose/phosphomannose isomerase [Nitrosotalea sinensis]|uniref:Putative bifunctional phosphoglucose/phosphomannose isomerase n=1 Tax=Nitrosotalea sinensis TaxID=1499975 RepID=A0A2H1EER7_9ARCH|nr:SIS domain-containing protein [Candidatus Nitrosotalea sinensis]SHO42869.1 putative bifunctional phosphoglucose/phosphomannose isomerase [Candidatus Nitrosotalea sinensis]